MVKGLQELRRIQVEELFMSLAHQGEAIRMHQPINKFFLVSLLDWQCFESICLLADCGIVFCTGQF